MSTGSTRTRVAKFEGRVTMGPCDFGRRNLGLNKLGMGLVDRLGSLVT